MKRLWHHQKKKNGFLLVEIVIAIALFAMTALVAGRLMVLQHKRMDHTRTILSMQEILEREKANVLTGRQDEGSEQQQMEFQVQKEEIQGKDEMGMQGLNSRSVFIRVQHKKTGWSQEILVITLDPGGNP